MCWGLEKRISFNLSAPIGRYGKMQYARHWQWLKSGKTKISKSDPALHKFGGWIRELFFSAALAIRSYWEMKEVRDWHWSQNILLCFSDVTDKKENPFYVRGCLLLIHERVQTYRHRSLKILLWHQNFYVKFSRLLIKLIKFH